MEAFLHGAPARAERPFREKLAAAAQKSVRTGFTFGMCDPMLRPESLRAFAAGGFPYRGTLRNALHFLPRIEEMAFGEYEGKCCARDHWELPEDFQKFFDDPVGFRPGKGGESFADVRKRTGEFLESLYKKAEGVYGNVLITTHGAALAGILNNIRKEPLEKYWGIGVHSNCAVTEVEVKNAEAQILSENVTYYKETVRPWAGN